MGDPKPSVARARRRNAARDEARGLLRCACCSFESQAETFQYHFAFGPKGEPTMEQRATRLWAATKRARKALAVLVVQERAGHPVTEAEALAVVESLMADGIDPAQAMAPAAPTGAEPSNDATGGAERGR